jgi:hypothetical protein
MTLMEAHLLWHHTNVFPLGKSNAATGSAVTAHLLQHMRASDSEWGIMSPYSPTGDFGSHQGVLRTALQRYSLDPRGRYPERKFPKRPRL